MSNPDDTSHSPQPGQVTPQGGSNSSPPTVNARWVPPTPLELQEQLPQYKVLEMIGHGGMGAVFKGWQVSLERYVAIKILPPSIQDDGENFAQRFQQEARTMAKMMHPGIVSVYDAGQTARGLLYFVMEFVEGEDVSQLLKRKGSLSSEYALAITAHVCDALHYAHTHGVVHRDIKPANIMLNSEGVVKVADFGLAKASGASSSGLTKSNISMGTPDYIAPEALVMGMFADHRADIYALGVMLYQMLTGKIPRGMCAPPSERKSGVDPRFDPIVIRAMKEEREERYQSVADMRRALDVILTAPHVVEAPAAAAPAPQVSAKPETRKPNPAAAPKAEVRAGAPKKAGAGMMAGVIGGVVALALVGWGVFKPKPKPDPTAERPEQNGTSASGTQPTPQPTPASQTLDLLALVDVAKDSVAGDWSMRADGVAVKTSNEVRLQLPYMPPQEYDFIIDFTVTQGSPDVRQILCVNGHDFLWRMGVNSSPKAPDKFGFELVEGKFITAGKTKTITPWKLENGVRYSAMLAVRKDGVTATVNGKQVTDFKTDFKDVSNQQGFKLKDPRLLGFGAWHCDVTFHRAEVREITGKGTLTRSTPPTNVPSGQGGPVRFSPSTEPWVDALADPGRLKLGGGALRTAEGLEVRADSSKFTQLAGPDLGVRVVAVNRNNGRPSIGLRKQSDSKSHYVICVPNTVNRVEVWRYSDVQPNGKIAEFPIGRTLQENDAYELEARIVGSKITVAFDGVVIGSVEDSTHKTGGAVFGSARAENPILLRGVQYLDLSAAKATATQVAPGAATVSADGWVNLLASVDLKRDVLSGEWSRKGADVVLARPALGVIEFNATIPEEYDFEIEFTPLDTGSHIQQLLSANGRRFSWKINIQGGANGLLSAFDMLDGKFSWDATEANIKHTAPIVEVGKRHRSTVEVRKGSVRGLIDGKELVKWSGDLNRFRTENANFRDPRNLGIGGFRRSVVFHKAVLRPAGESAGGGK